MIKIEFNQKLFDKHIEEISKSISKLISDLDNKDACLEYLSEAKEIENILKANTFQMKLYIEYFETNFPNSLEKEKELNRILREEIFEKEYKNWSSRKKYGAYYFVKALGLNSCPYCNRNYTFVVDNDNGKLRPEIDHFYPKAIYPFLAMSFYNLIPSCPICNHTKSDEVKDNLENPYDIEVNSYQFTYTPQSVEFTIVEEEKYNFDNFEIEISGNQSNIELFKLEELYKQHKDVVLELLIKKAYYPESYIAELTKFGFSKDEVFRYLFSNYNQEDDLHKRPLSKLTSDIAKELGLV